MILPILTQPNPLLHQKCSKVKVFDEKLKQLAHNMTETIFANKGIGLAAPQVGKTIRLIVIEFNPERFALNEDQDTNHKSKIINHKSQEIPLTILVNPKIISASKETEIHEEGCLSLPGVEVLIERVKEVKVLARGLEGNRLKIRANGLFARILQHEIDHLEGILITDRQTKNELKNYK